ncbi:hypothetical protein NC653_027305 [Populus alba x Populus x berolinensis]|uniref:Uncharacterized protein n=1 Tax=Populus alba x Populus x berolinensis TaxID=444605 RepID=A0AAD6Q4Z8_9ROSI|nr:hypothetical protein NC653_027305 [Populus alba x Populus x berolinensis]
MKEPKSWQTCQVGASASSIVSHLLHDITSQQQLKTTERERESVQVLHLKRELWPLSLHKTVWHLLSFNSSKMRIGFTSFLHFSHFAVALGTGRCVSTSMCACVTGSSLSLITFHEIHCDELSFPPDFDCLTNITLPNLGL